MVFVNLCEPRYLQGVLRKVALSKDLNTNQKL